MNITEILVPAQQTSWLPWAVQYFFYIGSAYAAAILFFVCYLMRNKTSHMLRSAFALVMAIGALVGPLSLTADLHQPGRAWHFFTHLTPWSWMSNGSIFLPIFSILAILTAWLYLRDELAGFANHPNSWLQKVSLLTLGQWQVTQKQIAICAGLTVVSGLSIALYTGMEIYNVTTRPLWHQPASPLLWFVTAFLAAVGLAMLLLTMMPTKNISLTELDKKITQKTMMVSAVAAFILMIIWSSNAGEHSLFMQSEWVVNLGCLLVLFSICAVISRFVLSASFSRTQALGFAILMILTAWFLRWVTLMDVQSIPKYDVGPYPYELPMGVNGLLGMVAMAGLWIALAALASELIRGSALQESESQANTQKVHSSSIQSNL